MNKYCRLMFRCSHCGLMSIKWFADKRTAIKAVEQDGPGAVLMDYTQFRKFVNENPHLNYIGEFYGEGTKIIYGKRAGKSLPHYSPEDVAIQARRKE